MCRKRRIGRAKDAALVVGGNGQDGRRDVCRGRGRSVGIVIIRVGTDDGNAAHRHEFARAGVLVGKGRSGVARAQAVARDSIIGKSHSSRGRAVVRLVGGDGGHRERTRGDVRCGCGARRC